MALKKKPLYYPVIAIFIIVNILLIGLGYYALYNLHRQEQVMRNHLTDLGFATIQAVESSSVIGMMGMAWQKEQLQSLFEKVSQQQNFRYMYLVDRTGQIVVSSDKKTIGALLTGPPLDFAQLPMDTVEADLVTRKRSGPVFEVRKQFNLRTASHHIQMMQQRMQNMGMMRASITGHLAIVVGLTTDDFYAARAEDTRRAIGSGAILLILALASTFFAVVIQKYYATIKSLKAAESFIRNVIESMGHGLVALDEFGKIVTINKKACQLMQVKDHLVQGRDFYKIMEKVECSIDKTAILQENWTEKKVRCSVDEHRTIPLSLTSRRILDEEGRLLGTVILMRDLQEIEALEEKVKRSERLASLGQMAAGIAHEIRNPLGSIKGLAQYFARKFEQEPEEKKYAEAIINETDRLNRVIGDLLDFARPQEPDYRQCRISQIINHALQLVKSDIEAKRIRIRRSGEENIPLIEADPDLLAQALMNLFLNAVEAMNAKGTLAISCHYRAKSRNLEIAIQDNGQGIPPAQLLQIFDPFFTSKKDGTGLGLALAHRIIDNHGGTIEVMSNVGKGTTFTIKLPEKP